jgi:hypothetical protein
MHDKLMKMLGKKRNLSEHEKNAKMDVMHEMRNEAANAMKDKMDGLKKVSVMANSKQGLQHGLEKAHDLVQGQDMDEDQDSDMDQAMAEGGMVKDESPDMMRAEAENPYHDNDMAKAEHAFPEGQDESEEEDPDHEGEESNEEELAEDHPSNDGHQMSEEEIDSKLKHLMSLKARLSKS